MKKRQIPRVPVSSAYRNLARSAGLKSSEVMVLLWRLQTHYPPSRE